MKSYILNNGTEMPSLGIGTFLLSPKEAEKSVITALRCGYRLVDTANIYCNERAVGRAIKACGRNRGEIFVSTKLWPSEYKNPEAVDQTLSRLGLDYIDLLFLHQPSGDWEAGYRQLERAFKEGKIRAIGISNFEGEYIEKLLNICEVRPQVMQVECHPYYPQTELRKLTDKYGIRIMSWYPLGGKGNTGKLLGEPSVTAFAEKYGKTPAQIILRWHIDMGFIVIPGSKDENHIRENFKLQDFKLSAEDMQSLEKLNSNMRFYNRTDAVLKSFEQRKPVYEEA